MRRVLVGGLVALVALTGCGGDDEKSTGQAETAKQPAAASTPTTPPTSTTPTTAAPEGVPTYEEAAEIALKNEATKRACSGGNREDNDVSGYPDETYKRLLCNGAPHMDYVVGKEAFADNFEPAREGRSPLWRFKDQAYISGPDLDEDFAQQIKDSCDCGEVVPGTG